MRKSAPTDVSVSKRFPGVIPRGLSATGRGRPSPRTGASAPDVETSALQEPPRIWAGYGPVLWSSVTSYFGVEAHP